MKSAKILLVIFSFLFFNTSFADISLGSTRVVISGGKNEGTVNVHNKDIGSYLIQSWVLDENDKASEDFVLTPPLFKLNANTSNSLRIMLVKDLPQDKELLYWLNVKFIPSSDKDDKSNKLTFAINNQIKLIYRPESISNHDMVDEFKKITIKRTGENLEFKNPTKHFINFSEVKADGVSLKIPSYIQPESSVSLPLKDRKKISKVEYVFIDDLGKLNLFETSLN
ncbi:molecular chaperone [Morganella psychrotolerans]|uniref:Molecular chaperone n=1 Tax=Morganella psychrotolerans TaxID=368603 RepID=A0A1B8HE78_9GAMM|nr:molecular chaperone [Morganella psychrotolerans]OBU07387.1 hypothetical protein AYY17_05130 [Morganella psychrotolerans]